MTAQFQKAHHLMLNSRPGAPRVLLVIDAVDECGTDDDISHIIELLPDAQGVNQTGLRILVTSQPLVATCNGFDHDLSKYRDQGRLAEAEKLEAGVMETRRKVLGEEHADTLKSMVNLAVTYHNQERWAAAEKLEAGAMETRKRGLGEEHADTLAGMTNLPVTYWKQERWSEAEQVEVAVMEARKRTLGEEHADTLASMASLALTYQVQGQWIKAEL
jgi:Tetratricopeptide repeat